MVIRRYEIQRPPQKPATIIPYQPPCPRMKSICGRVIHPPSVLSRAIFQSCLNPSICIAVPTISAIRSMSLWLQHPHNELKVTATSIVETAIPAVVNADSSPPWETVARQLHERGRPTELEACQFVFASPMVSPQPECSVLCQTFFSSGGAGIERCS